MACPRKIAALNTLAKVTFENIFERDLKMCPEVELYISGFPCTPFSRLHNQSKLLRDKNARQFWASIATLKDKRPPLAIFENVYGIKQVLGKVCKAMACEGLYRVLKLDLNPMHLGEPQHRPRIYFILVRCDAAVGSEEQMQSFAQHAWDSLRQCDHRMCHYQILPSDHPYVGACQQAQSDRKRVWGGHRWKQHHASTKLRLASKAAHDGGVTSALPFGLATEREKDIWRRLSSACPAGVPLCVDISQSLGRSVRADGGVPTIIPGGKFIVACGSARRTLTGIDKLMLQGFPVHAMKFPNQHTSAMLGRCAGNSMHVKCIAAAIYLGLACVTDLAAIARPIPSSISFQCATTITKKRKRAEKQLRAPALKCKRSRTNAFGGLTPKKTAKRCGGVTPSSGGVRPKSIAPSHVFSSRMTVCEMLFGN